MGRCVHKNCRYRVPEDGYLGTSAGNCNYAKIANRSRLAAVAELYGVPPLRTEETAPLFDPANCPLCETARGRRIPPPPVVLPYFRDKKDPRGLAAAMKEQAATEAPAPPAGGPGGGTILSRRSSGASAGA